MATKEKASDKTLSEKGSKDQLAKQEKKKSTKKKAEASNPSAFKRFRTYIKDVKSELHRVVWPTKHDVLNYTIVVLATLVFFGGLIYIIDSLIIPIFVAFAGLR